jgi:hypothetical protein
MTEDYASAARRHFLDGRILRSKGRIPNSDQLFGFAVECALKSVLVCLPGCASGGALQLKYREHVDALWGLVPLQGIQKRSKSLFVVLRSLREPFDDWSTSQRYESDRAVDAVAAERHFCVAKRVCGALEFLGELAED